LILVDPAYVFEALEPLVDEAEILALHGVLDTATVLAMFL
jgi:hypothetical protein